METMVSHKYSGQDTEMLSRRRILKAGTAAAGGLALGPGTGAAATDPVHSDEFEEREWGYVRRDFEPPESRKAAILEKDGYGSGEPATHYVRMRDDELIAVRIGDALTGAPLEGRDEYVAATASIRGTGCSGGTFDLYDRVHARDGYDLVEWLADRPWTLDGVGLFGFSYPGITAAFIAAEAPPSLAAVMPSGLIADQYRGNRIPGGVPNPAWGITWMLGLQPALAATGTASGAAAQDEICAQNVAARQPSHPADNPALLFTRRTDDNQWRTRSLITYLNGIEAPTYIAHAWQDRGTGPRGGPESFRVIDPDPIRNRHDHPGEGPPPGVPGLRPGESPKLFRGVNSGHGAPASALAVQDAEAWFDYWLLGIDSGIMKEPPVELHLNHGAEDSYTTFGLDEFFDPPETDWERFYLAEEGGLQSSPADAEEAFDTYVTGSPRQSWAVGDGAATDEATMADGPDILYYESDPFDEPKVIAGPITASLFIESTAAEMDLAVQIGDMYPDGSVVPLQFGVLRASHRKLDRERTLYNDDGEIIRPYRPHTNPDPITPGETYRYDVEVFPLGHLVYPEHRLVMAIHTPPSQSGLWGFEPSRVPGVNTVYRDESRPSSVLLPLADWEGDLPPEPECGEPDAHRCFQP